MMGDVSRANLDSEKTAVLSPACPHDEGRQETGDAQQHTLDEASSRASDDVTPPLKAVELGYTYRHAKEPVFSAFSMSVRSGKVLAIMGNNGAGKSTLLNLLAGIEKPTGGNVEVFSGNLADLNRREAAQHIAYVTQQQMVPHLRVYDEVLLGRRPHITWNVTDHDRDIVGRAIAELGLENFVDRYCDELSGGERQKVYIARAIAQEPEILIMDEPTSALDPRNQIEVLDAVRAITRQKELATVMVLHDINLALRFCDRFLLMRDGEVVSRGDLDSVTDETLTAAYGTEFKIVLIDGVRVAVPRI